MRGDEDDFEYVLAHRTMTFEDNRTVQGFLFWARVMAENAVLRHVWVGLGKLAGRRQSAVIESFGDWVRVTDEPAAAPLRVAAERAQGRGAGAYATAIGYLFTRLEGVVVLERWWAERIRPGLAEDVRPLLDAIFRYDLLTKPVCPAGADGDPVPEQLPLVEVAGERYYLRTGVRFSHDVRAALAAMRAGRPASLAPRPTELDLYYRVGALNAVRSTNHEEIAHFVGMTREEITPRAAPRVPRR